MFIQSSYLDQQILIAVTEHLSSGGFSGPLYNQSVALIAGNFQPSPQLVWANIVEANYSGYSRATGVTWGVPLLQTDGTFIVLTNLMTFYGQAASNFVSNVIWGWAMVDTANPPNILMSEVFAQPISIIVPNDGFGLVIQRAEGIANPQSQGNVII
jgi:hypothetical protein